MPHRASEITSPQAENARLRAMVERLQVGLDGESGEIQPGSSGDRLARDLRRPPEEVLTRADRTREGS